MTLLLFLDTETTGLCPYRDTIWEIGARMAQVNEEEKTLRLLGDYHYFLKVEDHHLERFKQIPQEFQDDFNSRYNESEAIYPQLAYEELKSWIRMHVNAVPDGKKPHLVGAVPSFDDQRIGMIARFTEKPWHFHLICVENLVAAHLGMHPPYDSNVLSRAVGVDNREFGRHTALGDVDWTIAQYAAVYDLEVIEID